MTSLARASLKVDNAETEKSQISSASDAHDVLSLFKCPVCLEPFDADVASFSNKRLSKLPVFSSKCSHKICCSCLTSMQMGWEGGNTSHRREIPKWLKCPICKAKTSFNAVDMPIDLFLCECMRKVTILEGELELQKAARNKAEDSLVALKERHTEEIKRAIQGLKEENERMETVVSRAQNEVGEWKQKYNEATAVVEELKKDKRETSTKNVDLDKASGAFSSKLVEDYSAKCAKLQDEVDEVRMINDEIEEQCLAARKESARLRLEIGRREIGTKEKSLGDIISDIDFSVGESLEILSQSSNRNSDEESLESMSLSSEPSKCDESGLSKEGNKTKPQKERGTQRKLPDRKTIACFSTSAPTRHSRKGTIDSLGNTEPLRLPCRGNLHKQAEPFVTVPAGASHGQRLDCSDPVCTKNSPGFVYCSFCRTICSVNSFNYRHGRQGQICTIKRKRPKTAVDEQGSLRSHRQRSSVRIRQNDKNAREKQTKDPIGPSRRDRPKRRKGEGAAKRLDLACCQCSQKFQTRAGLMSHLKICSEKTANNNSPTPYTCPCCPRRLQNRAALLSHMESKACKERGDALRSPSKRSNSNNGVDAIDHGEEHYGRRVAKYHVEDREEDGPRLCFGTVTNSGFPKFATNTMHWTVEFDEEDAVVYAHNGRGHLEDLNYDELMNAFELHKKKKEQDTKKPSVDCVV